MPFPPHPACKCTRGSRASSRRLHQQTGTGPLLTSQRLSRQGTCPAAPVPQRGSRRREASSQAARCVQKSSRTAHHHDPETKPRKSQVLLGHQSAPLVRKGLIVNLLDLTPHCVQSLKSGSGLPPPSPPPPLPSVSLLLKTIYFHSAAAQNSLLLEARGPWDEGSDPAMRDQGSSGNRCGSAAPPLGCLNSPKARDRLRSLPEKEHLLVQVKQVQWKDLPLTSL